jgi:hypothetical protein
MIMFTRTDEKGTVLHAFDEYPNEKRIVTDLYVAEHIVKDWNEFVQHSSILLPDQKRHIRYEVVVDPEFCIQKIISFRE